MQIRSRKMDNREHMLETIGRHKIIAIVRGVGAEHAAPLADALVAGGIRCMEVTMNTPGAFEMIRYASGRDGLTVGAGTVLTLEDADRSIKCGARFILSPVLSVGLIKYCNEQDILPVPGVFSPTELHAAYVAGARLIKVFPAGSVGPRFIKDLLGPFGTMKLMPVGGVSLENAGSFMQAGSYALGVGSSLVSPSLVEAGNFKEIERRAKAFVASVCK
jgi:2-dehydro-3-deoxyphosphogluconate aldolase/(4S)-4-hydroxy-2-oxoglutarate aldolase